MKKALLAITVLALGACGTTTTDRVTSGGALGVAAGAGTGAIIGTVIANGDVAASALLGGALGLPVGLALGAVYDYYSVERVVDRKNEEILLNQEQIYARQRDIDTLREEIRNDGPRGLPREDLREYQYNGATYGNYYR